MKIRLAPRHGRFIWLCCEPAVRKNKKQQHTSWLIYHSKEMASKCWSLTNYSGTWMRLCEPATIAQTKFISVLSDEVKCKCRHPLCSAQHNTDRILPASWTELCRHAVNASEYESVRIAESLFAFAFVFRAVRRNSRIFPYICGAFVHTLSTKNGRVTCCAPINSFCLIFSHPFAYKLIRRLCVLSANFRVHISAVLCDGGPDGRSCRRREWCESVWTHLRHHAWNCVGMQTTNLTNSHAHTHQTYATRENLYL